MVGLRPPLVDRPIHPGQPTTISHALVQLETRPAVVGFPRVRSRTVRVVLPLRAPLPSPLLLLLLLCAASGSTDETNTHKSITQKRHDTHHRVVPALPLRLPLRYHSLLLCRRPGPRVVAVVLSVRLNLKGKVRPPQSF